MLPLTVIWLILKSKVALDLLSIPASLHDEPPTTGPPGKSNRGASERELPATFRLRSSTRLTLDDLPSNHTCPSDPARHMISSWKMQRRLCTAQMLPENRDACKLEPEKTGVSRKALRGAVSAHSKILLREDYPTEDRHPGNIVTTLASLPPTFVERQQIIKGVRSGDPSGSKEPHGPRSPGPLVSLRGNL